MKIPEWRGAKFEKDEQVGRKRMKINFKSKFNVIELTPDGSVVDIGDDDYQPSERWRERRGGFEYKKGIRGVGYYRTGIEPKHPDPFKITMSSTDSARRVERGVIEAE